MAAISGVTSQDRGLIERAVELALVAGARGDLPVGSLITLDGEVPAEGSARILSEGSGSARTLSEGCQPRGHAEQEALAGVPLPDRLRCHRRAGRSSLPRACLAADAAADRSRLWSPSGHPPLVTRVVRAHTGAASGENGGR